MKDTKILLLDTAKGLETLCGILQIVDQFTVQGQTYKISCGMKCGNVVQLRVKHEKGKYDLAGAIQIKEIEAYTDPDLS